MKDWQLREFHPKRHKRELLGKLVVEYPTDFSKYGPLVFNDLELCNPSCAGLSRGITVKGTLAVRAGHYNDCYDIPAKSSIHNFEASSTNITLNYASSFDTIKLYEVHVRGRIPDDIFVRNVMDITHSSAVLPNYLNVGSLIARHADVDFPDQFEAPCMVDISDSTVRQLPTVMKCTGLDISNTKISVIPDELSTDNLILSYCNIAHMPEDFRVYRYLKCVSSVVENLPSDLAISSDLILDSTIINRPVSNMFVSGNLYCTNTFCTIKNLIVCGDIITDINTLCSLAKNNVLCLGTIFINRRDQSRTLYSDLCEQISTFKIAKQLPSVTKEVSFDPKFYNFVIKARNYFATHGIIIPAILVDIYDTKLRGDSDE